MCRLTFRCLLHHVIIMMTVFQALKCGYFTSISNQTLEEEACGLYMTTFTPASTGLTILHQLWYQFSKSLQMGRPIDDFWRKIHPTVTQPGINPRTSQFAKLHGFKCHPTFIQTITVSVNLYSMLTVRLFCRFS